MPNALSSHVPPEDAIKKVLDGWFFTIDHFRERTRAVRVPADFIPEHRPSYMVDETEPHSNARFWRPEEDDTIFTMRSAGERWSAIAKAIGVSMATATKRYHQICVARGVEPLSNELTASRKFTPEQAARVVELRKAGLQFAEIGEILGIDRIKANHIFLRWQKRQQARGLAA